MSYWRTQVEIPQDLSEIQPASAGVRVEPVPITSPDEARWTRIIETYSKCPQLRKALTDPRCEPLKVYQIARSRYLSPSTTLGAMADELPLSIDVVNALQTEYVKSRTMLHAYEAHRNALWSARLAAAHFQEVSDGTQHGEYVPPKRSYRAAQLAAMKNSPQRTQPKKSRRAAKLAPRNNSPVFCELQQDVKAETADLNTSSSPKFVCPFSIKNHSNRFSNTLTPPKFLHRQ